MQLQQENKLKNDFKGLGPYVVLWSGQTLSEIGTSMTGYALILWIYQKTGSALSMALLTLCTYAPSIAVSLFAGAICDRFNRKKKYCFATRPAPR